MKKRLIILMVLCALSYTPDVIAQEKKRPNVIFILADDLGWSSLSVNMDRLGGKSDYHETPNLEKLARQGMRFTRGYAGASICSPSRRSILYGRTPARLGDESFADHYHPASTSARSLPQVLKAIDNRYRAAHFGKWDMRADFFPEDAGYDESDGNTGNRTGDLMTGDDDKWTSHFIVDDPKKAHSITARANNFMERQVRLGNPFYLQISHYATHVDVQSTKQSFEKYKSKPVGKKDNNAAFAAMLEDLDNAIGDVLKKVENLGISDNTYIFFMADNGATEFFPPVKNRLDHPKEFKTPMRNFPLRGGKWTLYEGGIRVPMIVSGPGVSANSFCDVPVVGWDLLPTLAELAGGGSGAVETPDGGSFAGVLRNEGAGTVRRATRDLVFHRYNNGYPHSALIDGNMKVIRFWKTGALELYDLASDPGEEHNLASSHEKKARDMAARLAAYLEKVNPGLLATYTINSPPSTVDGPRLKKGKR